MMIKYKKGNILDSNASALVNTVNCEGYMGKGIAYQFKLRFPNNNIHYVNACNDGTFRIGEILSFEEDGKTILNFPTKDRWRKKSEYSFIEKGLERLHEVLIRDGIKSVAIPPLGCGNGGLEWEKVKELILHFLGELSNKIEIEIYEPYKNNSAPSKKHIKKAPKLSSSHLLLMKLKISLTKFNKLRLQKAAFLNNIYARQDYFKFSGHNFGPYAYSIEILSREIKEYQKYYGLTTKESYEKGMQTLVSKNLKSKIKSFDTSLNLTAKFINSIQSDKELELLTSILFLLKENHELKVPQITEGVRDWNQHKKLNFEAERIEKGIKKLSKIGLIKETLYDSYEIGV